MGYLSRLFLAVFICYTGALNVPEASHRTAQGKSAVSRGGPTTLPPPYLNLPVYVDSRNPLVAKEYFLPAAGTGLEPLEQAVQEVLIPTGSSTGPPNVSGVLVKVWCESEKMRVQVPRSVLGGGDGDVSALVKVGTCRANISTAEYLLFEFDLKLCGAKQTMSNNQLMYSTILQYDPPRPEGPIRRATPFTLPVACFYNRHLYSYKIGYQPRMQMPKIYKPMRSSATFILTMRNAQWERLSLSDEYVLGQPMYFEIEAPSIAQHKRLYVQSCYVTPKKSLTSTPQFSVVENFGCMVESKDGRSRFIPYKPTAVRFSVDAFLLNETSNQLFMHCNMSVGSTMATPVAKSCNYDTRTKRWVELYGSDLVCACCESTCTSALSPRSVEVRTRSWTIKPALKPAAASKRKTMSTTRTTTSAAKPQAITLTSVRKTYLQSKVSGNKDSVWTYIGQSGVKGMAWIEEDDTDEKFVKGAAVLEEEDEKEKVIPPRLIFEEVFGLGK